MRGLRRHRHFWPITVAITTLAVTMATLPGLRLVGAAVPRADTAGPQERDLPRAAHRGHRGPDHRQAGPLPCRRGQRPARRTRPGRSCRRRAPSCARTLTCPRTCTRWPAAATRCSRPRTTSGSPGPAAATPRRPLMPHPPSRSTSRPPTSAATCCGMPAREFVRTMSRRRSSVSPSPAKTADWTVEAVGLVVRVHASVHEAEPQGRRRRASSRDGHDRHAVRAEVDHRLPGVARGRRERHRRAVRRHDVAPGGARLHRRAHPRHGLRVPRRRRALRTSVASVRRRRRARRTAPTTSSPRAPAPCWRTSLARHAGRHARPGRLADVQGLAGTRLADPRGHVLEVARALVARRPAHPGQPAGREQQALRALPDQAQLLQRHEVDPPAGRRHAQARALHRRAVRRARPRLVPHRHRPVRGPEGHQRRARWPSSWASRPAWSSAAR